MAEVASPHAVDSSWVLWAASLAYRRQRQGDYYVSRNLGARKVYSDSPHDLKPRASVWEKTASKLREMEINPIVYAPNLFRIILGRPDEVFPEPNQLASPHYVDLVQRDLPRRIRNLRLEFQLYLQYYKVRASYQARLIKGEAEDVVISTLLAPNYGFSGVFKFAMAWSYGTPATRKAAREYFLREASQDLFTCWDAYPKALGECLPKCLIKETPRVYFQVLKDVVAKIETQRGNCTQA